MSRDDDRDNWGAGFTALLAVCAMLTLCGGGLLALLGGSFYFARQQVIQAQQAEMAAREQALMAQLEAMRHGERMLPQGAHAIAIGPEGELFWDDQPVELQQLEATLQTLAPVSERADVSIHIRPGYGAPDETVQQVRELCRGYDEVFEPLPSSSPNFDQ